MKIVAGEGKKSEILGGPAEGGPVESGPSWEGRSFFGSPSWGGIPTLAKHGNWLKTLKHEFCAIWPQMVGLGKLGETFWRNCVWPKLATHHSSRMKRHQSTRLRLGSWCQHVWLGFWGPSGFCRNNQANPTLWVRDTCLSRRTSAFNIHLDCCFVALKNMKQGTEARTFCN